MTTTEFTTTQETTPSDRTAVRRRGDLAVFAASFVSLLTLLLVRNRWLFSDRVYEAGDAAANSIITGQAKDFDLLVGNYSRLGFSHPGPAFFYVQGFGEWLVHDLLGVVPTPWNGQAVAIIALNSALLALALTVLYSWFRSVGVVAACGGAVLGFLAWQDHALVTETWMPYEYFAPFVLLLVAGASVAAGRTGHLWLVALAAGFLVHGHASFLLLFVPVILVAVLATLLWPRRRELRAFVAGQRRDWLVAAGVAGVFLFPMVLNLALNWPGEYWDYIRYGGSDSAGWHPPDAAAEYVLWYWDPTGWKGALLAFAGFAAAGLLAWRAPVARRFLVTGVAAGGLVTLLVFGYATKGIDDLQWRYVAFFYWSVPLLVLLLVVAGAVAWLAALGPRVLVAGVGLVVLVAGVVVASRSTDLVGGVHADSTLPGAVEAMADRADGDPVALDIEPATWPAATGLLVQGERRDVRVCVADPRWEFLVTSEFVCTEDELAEAERLDLRARRQPPADEVLVARVVGAVITDSP